MNKHQITTLIIAAIAIVCMGVGLAGIISKPAASRTINACTDVKLPEKGCKTTRKRVHGYKVTITVCK